MAKDIPATTKASPLYAKSEADIADRGRILALDRLLSGGSSIAAAAFLSLEAALALFIGFFQITDLAAVKGIPRIPALGLFVLPCLLALGSGVSLLDSVRKRPIRRFLRKPEDFRILTAKLIDLEKTKNGKAIVLTLRYESQPGEGLTMEFQARIKSRYWVSEVLPSIEARIICDTHSPNDKALLALIKRP